ncbi:MAG: hypothetical protein R2932_26845 [Caldilineaceae bacterium]
MRKEIAERVDIAVDAFEQLAGEVGPVKFAVERQAVGDDIFTQVVGRLPADVGAEIGHGQPQQLFDQRNRQEEARRAQEYAECAARLGCVEKAADDLGIDQLGSKGCQQGEPEQQHL